MRGKKYGDEIKEKAYMLHATGKSIAEVSSEIGVPANTISTWLKNKKPDKFDELRDEKKREFIDQASDLIMKAMCRLGEELDNRKVPIPVNHLTTVIGTLYDKRALARGETTENTKITVKLPQELTKYAG